jgi:hypothetical protein
MDAVFVGGRLAGGRPDRLVRAPGAVVGAVVFNPGNHFNLKPTRLFLI